jgi:hypothetical protein
MEIIGMYEKRRGVPVAKRTVQEIGSYLVTRRTVVAGRDLGKEAEVPHRRWNATRKAALVILWGLLVYPRLDPDVKESQGAIRIDDLIYLFGEMVGGRDKWLDIIRLLRKHDYVRLAGDLLVPGTRLLTAVDAAKMYRCFRSSVLSRQVFMAMRSDEN